MLKPFIILHGIGEYENGDASYRAREPDLVSRPMSCDAVFGILRGGSWHDCWVVEMRLTDRWSSGMKNLKILRVCECGECAT